MERVQLLCSRRAGWAMLRELCGHDEETVGGVGVLDAVALVDRLLVASPGAAIATGEAAELAVADRDRVLAAIYVRAFGSRITADLPCAQCGVQFELELELGAVAGELTAQTTRADGGWYRVGDGPRFRLPTATDELLPPGDIVTDEPPPGVTVVLPLSPPEPVVTVVLFDPSLVVTTRHGLPLTMTVPPDPEATATLSARAGAARPARASTIGKIPLRMRITEIL